MLKTLAFIVTTALASINNTPAFAAEQTTINMIGEQRYRVPLSYRPVPNGKGGISILVSFPNFGPLVGDKPGWDDNAQILVQKQINTIGMLWDTQWDGTPTGMVEWNTIQKTYRIEPEFTVQEMGSGFDIVIPDQNLEAFPLGLLRCDRRKEGTYPACSHLFDMNGQRWQVSFGRQFIHNFRQIRERAVTLVNSFKEQ